MNAQSTTVWRQLYDNFKWKKSIFAKKPGKHFALKISTNQGFETYAQQYRDANLCGSGGVLPISHSLIDTANS